MSPWSWLLAACAVAYATKLAGFLVPDRWLASPGMIRITTAMTVALLAALTATTAFSGMPGPMLDARLGALVAAGLALWWRLPFLAVVVIGAVIAALLRVAGLP